MALAECHEINADVESARISYQSAADLNVDCYELLFRHARLEMDAGNEDEAKRLFKNAIKLHKDIPEPHFYLGQLLEREGEIDKAQEHFEQAKRLDPLESRFSAAVKTVCTE